MNTKHPQNLTSINYLSRFSNPDSLKYIFFQKLKQWCQQVKNNSNNLLLSMILKMPEIMKLFKS